MKELAAKLKIADALLKKIVKDFDIPTAKVKSRVHLEDSSVQTVREIMALRASGKKTKEIKELFDASKETTKPDVKESTSQSEKKEVTDSSTPNQVKKKKILVEKQENAVSELKENPEAQAVTEETKKPLDTRTPEEIEEARARAKAKSNKRKAKIKKAKAARELNAKNLEGKYVDTHDLEDDHKNSMMNLNEYLDSNETDNDFKSNLNINEDDSDLDEDLSIDGIDDEDDEDEDPKSDSKTKTTNKKAKIRRRQFSYKYIQRQIMNDQKRVQYIQQRLQRGRLSTKEKMELEESLEIRDKLLAEWVKLLRWVKS